MKIGFIIFGLLAVFSVPAYAQDGKALYEKNCKMCHGVDGKGVPGIAKGMAGGDLTKLDLTDKETTDKKDAELTKSINDGVGKMKPFKDKLKTEEICAILQYVRTLKK